MTADSPIFSTPLFRHREEAGGRRGDLKPGKIITIEIATVAALLRNDNLKGVGVSIDSDPYAFAEKHSPSGLGSYNHETRRKARGSPHRGRMTADSPLFSTPLFRHREEAGGRRGDLYRKEGVGARTAGE